MSSVFVSCIYVIVEPRKSIATAELPFFGHFQRAIEDVDVVLRFIPLLPRAAPGPAVFAPTTKFPFVVCLTLPYFDEAIEVVDEQGSVFHLTCGTPEACPPVLVLAELVNLETH